MSKPSDYPLQVYRSLMDLDLLLQDGSEMVSLWFFLGSIDPNNAALEKLHKEILAFIEKISKLCAAGKQLSNIKL